MARARRVYHEDVAGPGSVLSLGPDESHHARDVLRLGPGDALSVFDGRGREWEATLAGVSHASVVIRVGLECEDRVDPVLPVTLFQGLCRPDRMEWAIQKVTEVGAAGIRPVLLRRAEERLPSPERLDRWRKIAREATKQSGRRFVPDVAEPAPVPEEVPSGTLAILLVPAPDVVPLGDHLRRPRPESVWLLVGPEGGFDPEEVDLFARGGWRRASLGPRTLRTETAGVVACALALHVWGDLGA